MKLDDSHSNVKEGGKWDSCGQFLLATVLAARCLASVFSNEVLWQSTWPTLQSLALLAFVEPPCLLSAKFKADLEVDTSRFLSFFHVFSDHPLSNHYI